MKRNNSSSALDVMIFLLIVFTTFSFICFEARKQKGEGGDHTAPFPILHLRLYPNWLNSFDILSFGAKGDGISDDSTALLAAWGTACKVPWATVEIPSEFKFLIKPISLEGPCMPHLVLQLLQNFGWPNSSLFQWINFKGVHNFTIQGTGTVDGQGSNWWRPSPLKYIQKELKKIPAMRPTALRFFDSYNVTVRNIRIINSPRCHLKFDNSGQVKIHNITISSPGDTPNTDGIHLQNSHDIEIQDSHVGCGDDCVSIQTGCSNVHVHHTTCGPGHGISLGGLGKNRSVACVSNIVVDNISMQNTRYGVRIKTWQYYCDKNLICKNQTGGVAISGVKYDQIVGTYWQQPIKLACNNDIPCNDVDLINIKLKPTPGYQKLVQAFYWNSFGKSKAQAHLVPSSRRLLLKQKWWFSQTNYKKIIPLKYMLVKINFRPSL